MTTYLVLELTNQIYITCLSVQIYKERNFFGIGVELVLR